MMNNKSLVAKWISQCEEKIDKNCENNYCNKCIYEDICIEVSLLAKEFESKEYIK